MQVPAVSTTSPTPDFNHASCLSISNHDYSDYSISTTSAVSHSSVVFSNHDHDDSSIQTASPMSQNRASLQLQLGNKDDQHYSSINQDPCDNQHQDNQHANQDNHDENHLLVDQEIQLIKASQYQQDKPDKNLSTPTSTSSKPNE